MPFNDDSNGGFCESQAQIMQKNYDVHRAVTRQSRRMELHYKGVIDFGGGAYGILKVAVEREIEMEGGIEGTGTGLLLLGGDLQRRQRAVELKDRGLQQMEREVGIMERMQAVREREMALKTNTGGAGGSATGDGREITERASQPAEREQAPTGGGVQSQVLQNHILFCN